MARWDVKEKKRTVIADSYKGKRFNAPNDLVIDAKGRIYFSDPRYLGDEPRELEHRAVYRIDTDGSVVELTHEVEKPNGVALSPDGKTFYLIDHNNGTRQDRPGQAGAEEGRDEGLRLPARRRRPGEGRPENAGGLRRRRTAATACASMPRGTSTSPPAA